jgi:formamidopyrimidine-DNA glycosylase
MPELPEVKVTSERIQKITKGKQLTDIEFISGRYTKSQPKGFAQFSKALPMRIVNVDSKGKLMYFVLQDSNGEMWTIFNTFGLTGEWQSVEESKFIRVVFEFSGSGSKTKEKINANAEVNVNLPPHSPKYLVSVKSKQKSHFANKLYYSDQRNFGTFIFLHDPNQKLLNAKLDSLGPDILTDTITKTIFEVSTSRETVYEFLMDQSNISGIGNYLSHEILYLAKISPLREIGSLTDLEKRRLLVAMKVKVKQSYLFQGGTKDYLPEIQLKTQFHFAIYGKKECPKGHTLSSKKGIIKGRTIHWCSEEQR